MWSGSGVGGRTGEWIIVYYNCYNFEISFN